MNASARAPGDRPRLAAGVRVQKDRVGGQDVLLFPEGIFVLNSTAAEIVSLCDGRRTVADVASALAARHDAPPESIAGDVTEYLARLGDRGLIVWSAPGEESS